MIWVATGSIDMANRNLAARGLTGDGVKSGSRDKEVPIQVMVPETVRRQVALMGADRGENIRTVVLRGLRAIGIEIPDSELADRRGRRRNGNGDGHGAQ
jgi:hypothetical protein